MSAAPRHGFGALALAFALLAAAPVVAGPRRAAAGHAEHGSRAGKAEPAQSIGPPNAGHLAGAARLKGSRTLGQREGAHSWGTPQLVRALTRAADRVARKQRGSVLFVGDLSARGGGFLPGHNSHQSGRDADVGFYVTSSKGKPVHPKRFVAFGADGRARGDVDGMRFDDTRNWLFVEALLEDKDALVRYVFVSNPLKARLLQAGVKKHATKEQLLRASQAMLSPDNADVHDDHFHVRIACPASMRSSCVEESAPRSGGGHAGSAAIESGVDPYAPGLPRASSAAPADAPSPPAGAERAKPGDAPPPPALGDD